MWVRTCDGKTMKFGDLADVLQRNVVQKILHGSVPISGVGVSKSLCNWAACDRRAKRVLIRLIVHLVLPCEGTDICTHWQPIDCTGFCVVEHTRFEPHRCHFQCVWQVRTRHNCLSDDVGDRFVGRELYLTMFHLDVLPLLKYLPRAGREKLRVVKWCRRNSSAFVIPLLIRR